MLKTLHWTTHTKTLTCGINQEQTLLQQKKNNSTFTQVLTVRKNPANLKYRD